MTARIDPILPALPNFREVRGLHAQDGRALRGGMIFRSEAVLSPSEEEARILRTLGIRTIFDLRGPGERADAPNIWWRAEGADIRDIDLVADARNAGSHWESFFTDPDGKGGTDLMIATYRALPRGALAHVGSLFSALVDGGAPILIHCAAGKDRTGFMVAAVLTAIGITPEAVRDDYLESGARPNPAVNAMTRDLLAKRLGRAPADSVLAALTGVDPAYLDASFAAIEAEYGSTDAYFTAAGWDRERRARLCDALLV
ncbi:MULTISPECIES: tyrosine-protein phosphatase [unclassified Sphingobium]|uniref:tyrosine-protein phosphatase n=1 Tax=unclassified Sphingobium TaxID=2611147 RepID=UPI000D176B99|nr:MULTISPECIES: tyrosine-protein phosphatase [unclassified Sphingobium]MBG6120053.1 protein-tyrosine phosphatase [Sphingobium sp. JAI105]PSO12893.1 hypothetical protein C7E20_03850 [Sphingobium sp. AEW4]TWD05746.1 protein-tyrosine phosphatase [Sphingobium sp. AEW010]TWD23299.1 protein-tyrosine phosphatase [Sphingobium sp. AEW013]TWD25159.1 protein-tyrosine phosphatase [Sphingobium sp. AEW001]